MDTVKKGILCNDSKMQGPEKYNRIRYEFVTGDDMIPSDVTVSLGDVDPLTGKAITDVEIFQDYRRMRNRQVYCNLRVSRPEYAEKEKEERRLERLRIAEEFRADYGYEPTPEVVRYLQDSRWKSRYVLSLDSFVNEEENESTLDYVSEMADPSAEEAFRCLEDREEYARLLAFADTLEGRLKDVFQLMVLEALGENGAMNGVTLEEKWHASKHAISRDRLKLKEMLREWMRGND